MASNHFVSVLVHALLLGNIFRPLLAEPPQRNGLTTAAAVRSLPWTEAAKAWPVRLSGVMLLAGTEPDAVVLMDESEGIYIQTPGDLAKNAQPGDLLDVIGTTAPGAFAPIVVASAITTHGRRPLSPPQKTTISDLAAGGYDARWIALDGIVLSCESEQPVATAKAGPGEPAGKDGEDWVVNLAQGDNTIGVRIHGRLHPEDLVDAKVEIHGVCFNVHNSNRQFVRANVEAGGPEAIRIVTAPPADPFALPLKRAEELLQFSRDGFSGHRVHVRGIVTRDEKGNTLWIRDGDRGLRVESRQSGEVVLGDLVDVAGFEKHGGYSPILANAIFRIMRHGPPPKPTRIQSYAEALSRDANLVQLEGTLSDISRNSSGLMLTLTWNGLPVHALLLGATGQLPIEAGSRVELTGICSLEPGSAGPTKGLWEAERLVLLLRDPGDILMLRPAPWLNRERTTLLLSTATGVLLIILISSSIAARRKIASQRTMRKMAEVEFLAILSERNRMARDVHDTLAQGLNAVAMQLELAKRAANLTAEKAMEHVGVARAIVGDCIVQTRESIWNMRSQVLEKSDLPGALDGVLRQMSAGLNLTTRLEAHGEPRRLAPLVENNLLRMGQEAIANAIKHSGATALGVLIYFRPSSVRVVVEDNGRGFDPAKANRATSHFGLRGMRERIDQMSGKLRIRAAPKGGTILEITVPILG